MVAIENGEKRAAGGKGEEKGCKWEWRRKGLQLVREKKRADRRKGEEKGRKREEVKKWLQVGGSRKGCRWEEMEKRMHMTSGKDWRKKTMQMGWEGKPVYGKRKYGQRETVAAAIR